MKKWEKTMIQHLALNQTQLDERIVVVYQCCSCGTRFNSEGQGIKSPYTIIKNNNGNGLNGNIKHWKCSHDGGEIIKCMDGYCS